MDSRLSFSICLVLGVLAVSNATSKTVFDIQGTRVLPGSQIEEWLESDSIPHSASDSVLLSYIADYLESRLQEEGFTHARVWTRKKGKNVQVYVDEGRIHQTAIIGVGAVDAVFYRVDLRFPQDIFQQSLFDDALSRMQEKYALAGIYGEVRTSTRRVRMPFGEEVPEQELVVQVVRNEPFGWGFNIEFSPQWGLLPGVSTRHSGVMLNKDLLRSEIRIAIPYREYIVQENPTFQWVHGRGALRYRFPYWGAIKLAPGLDAVTSLSKFSRSDTADSSLLTSRTESHITAEYAVTQMLHLQLGAGTDVIGNVALGDGPLQFSAAGLYPDPPVTRFGGKLGLQLHWRPGILREDHRSSTSVVTRLYRRPRGVMLTDVESTGHLTFLTSDHEFNLNHRVVYLQGDVQFWDERYLTGSFLRTHFRRPFWTRKAIQLAAGAQWGVGGDSFQLGIFHDLSVFEDLQLGAEKIQLANGFGPSLHTLILGIFSLDVYYGVGFSPSGFGQSFVIGFKRVL